MKKILIAAAVVIFSSSASVAAPPSPVYGWTGFYAGVNVGGGWTDRTSVANAPNDAFAEFFFASQAVRPTGDSFKSSGVLGGVQLGYNYQFDRNWVAGLETDFQFADISGSGSTVLAPPAFVFSTASEQIKYFGTVRARLGYLPTEKLLIFATGGFAYAQINHSGGVTTGNNSAIFFTLGNQSILCGLGFPPGCFAGSQDRFTPGYTVGGGVEYALWQNWTVKGEYLFAQFKDTVTSVSATAPFAPVPTSYTANFTTNLNIVRIGLNYKFAN